MEQLEATGVRPRQVRYQAALRPDCKGFMRNFPRVHPKGRRAIRARLRPVPARLAARYNQSPGMLKPRYALVAYVKSPAGEFVETLRRELHPALPHMPAHLTILPPRL